MIPRRRALVLVTVLVASFLWWWLIFGGVWAALGFAVGLPVVLFAVDRLVRTTRRSLHR